MCANVCQAVNQDWFEECVWGKMTEEGRREALAQRIPYIWQYVSGAVIVLQFARSCSVSCVGTVNL